MTLIHTLPYLPHASHTGGHLSGLAKREAGVYAYIRSPSHAEVRTTSIPLLPSTQTVDSVPQREVALTEVCS